MHHIISIVGVVVIVLAILAFFGLRSRVTQYPLPPPGVPGYV
ncbi:MAG TPA: hypothetical protein VHN13_07975 [Candidatus Tectomicrobia bacterium]|jgi:hypothetical protein|nr:hypothetical protein [Candidatus Tectomicrobia bacterium]